MKSMLKKGIGLFTLLVGFVVCTYAQVPQNIDVDAAENSTTMGWKLVLFIAIPVLVAIYLLTRYFRKK